MLEFAFAAVIVVAFAAFIRSRLRAGRRGFVRGLLSGLKTRNL